MFTQLSAPYAEYEAKSMESIIKDAVAKIERTRFWGSDFDGVMQHLLKEPSNQLIKAKVKTALVSYPLMVLDEKKALCNSIQHSPGLIDSIVKQIDYNLIGCRKVGERMRPLLTVMFSEGVLKSKQVRDLAVAYAHYYGAELVLRVWQSTEKTLWVNKNITGESTTIAIEFDVETFITQVAAKMGCSEKPSPREDSDIDELRKRYMPKNEISTSKSTFFGSAEGFYRRYPNAPRPDPGMRLGSEHEALYLSSGLG